MFGLSERELSPVTGSTGLDPELPHQRLLARQLRTHCGFRFGVTALIVGGALFAPPIVGIVGLRTELLIAVALAIALLNTVSSWLVRGAERLAPPSRARARLLALRHATILGDYVALTVLIALVGGARSPFLAVFLLHIVLGSMMASRTAAWVYAAVAATLLNVIVLGELFEIWRPALPEGAVASAASLDARYAATVSVVYTFLFVVTTALLTQLAGALRRLERELIVANEELTRLSCARRDFLHVALHNLKAPLAASSMLLDNLAAGLAGPLDDKPRDVVGRVQTRLGESQRFIHDLDLLASLEARQLTCLDTNIVAHELLTRVAEEYRELAQARGQRIVVEPAPAALAIRGNERMLKEAVVNLVTNAIKYSPRGGEVRLRARRVDVNVRLEVVDSGPGIAPELQNKLFREFSRLNTVLPDGERPPGSGLGLSIVRHVAEAHGGRVDVASEVGCGSTFGLALPALLAADAPAPGASAPEPRATAALVVHSAAER